MSDIGFSLAHNAAHNGVAEGRRQRFHFSAIARRFLAILIACSALVCVSAPFCAPAAAEARLALVIGNESYDSLDQLPYATQNAEQVAEALSQVGFRSVGSDDIVAPALDLDGEGMVAAITAFETALENADAGAVGVLYFAGHGMARARRGDVYLMPIDVSGRGARLDAGARGSAGLDAQGVPLADILHLLRRHENRTVVLVVDACRNVAPSSVGVVTRSVTTDEGGGWGETGGAIGLLQRGRVSEFAEPSAKGADYFVAFSTSPDTGAYDSDVFSSILSEEIRRGHDLLSLFKRVGERMANEAPPDRRQLPTYEVGVYGELPCFGPCAVRVDPDRFYDCAGCPWMRVVRAGEFTYGSPASEIGRDDDEPLAANAEIAHDFAIGVYEVNRAEWRACARAGACRRLTNRNTWLSDLAPVGSVGREDAEAFLAWLSAQSPARYRLPTESEWEYAARAGTETSFYFGDQIAPSLSAYDYSASYRGSPRAEYRGAPEAGGAFPPNNFGLYDMLGNMWEWTQSCVSDGHTQCADWVLRGGSFKSEPSELRAANRFVVRPTNRREDVGLRVARDM